MCNCDLCVRPYTTFAKCGMWYDLLVLTGGDPDNLLPGRCRECKAKFYVDSPMALCHACEREYVIDSYYEEIRELRSRAFLRSPEFSA